MAVSLVFAVSLKKSLNLRSILRGFFTAASIGAAVWGVAINPAYAQSDNTYVVALNNAPPYRIIAGEGEKTYSGIYIDLAKELARRAGITLAFKEVPFSRALLMMEGGTADIMLGPNRSDEREKFMIYLEAPLASEPKAFYVGKGVPIVQSYADLAGRRIGVLRNSKYFPEFDRDLTLKKIETTSYEQAFELLSIGRIDVVIAPEMLGDFKATDYIHDQRVVKSSYLSPGRLSYITVSRQSALNAEVARLTKLLDEIQQDGTYAKILALYQ